MNYYIDIHIQKDPDFPINQIFTALYMRLHQALVELQENGVGVSFPQYQRTPRSIGSILRLHGNQERLGALLNGEWLQKGLRDHLKILEVTLVPEVSRFYLVSRVQPKYNVERLIRRFQSRKGISYEQAAEVYSAFKPSTEVWPFIQMRSQSRQQTFSLLINQRIVENRQIGIFSSYGLSSTATVPCF